MDPFQEKQILINEAKEDILRAERKFQSLWQDFLIQNNNHEVEYKTPVSRNKIEDKTFKKEANIESMTKHPVKKVLSCNTIQNLLSPRLLYCTRKRKKSRTPRKSSSNASNRSSKNLLSRSKHQLKLKVVQPHALRQPPESDEIKKIFAFGSSLTIGPTTENKCPAAQGPLPFRRTLVRAEQKRALDLNLNGQLVPKYLPCCPKSSSFEIPSSYTSLDEMALMNIVERKTLPFVPCRSTARSHNLNLNLQGLLSLIKNECFVNRKGKVPTLRGTSSRAGISPQSCPAMDKHGSEYSRDSTDVWSGSGTAKCTCFPTNVCQQPYDDLGWEHWSQYTDSLMESCVNVLKDDWSHIHRLNTLLHNCGQIVEPRNTLETLGLQLQHRESCYSEVNKMLREVKELKKLIRVAAQNLG